MIAASILSGRALAPIEQLISSWKNFQSTKFSYSRLSKLLHDYPVQQKGVKLPRPSGNYSVDSIYVTPPKSTKSIINGISFNITAGEILGIIGPSGSGKTTLARVMTGVWPCQLGTVRLDGAVIYDWDKAELGPAIGYLPQDIELLSGTVAENIARFCEPNSELVIQAAKSVGIHELILKLPAGYETQVGEFGNSLSGGERQRIGLARAIYAEPSVLILDEPNSNLDELGEISLLKTILDAKSRGATCVVITHRDQILKAVDKLLVLVDGEIKLLGQRDKVLTELSRLGNLGVS
jgi:ATP-binding cassette subfamily C exporter for protease/lipase